MAERLDPALVREYANTFALAFKNSGVLSGLTGGGGATVGGGSQLLAYKELEEQEKVIKTNNRLLKEYVKIQDKLSGSTKQRATLEMRRGRIERALAKDSILLGNSFTSAAEKIKRDPKAKEEILEFIKDSDIDKISKDFSEKVEVGGEKVDGALKNVAKKIGENANRLASQLFAGVTFSQTLIGGMRDFQSALKFGSDFTQNIVQRQINASLMGLSTQQLDELEAQNRRLVNALGSATLFEGEMRQANEAYFMAIGDLGETTQFTGQMMRVLNIAGAKTKNSLLGLDGEMSPLGKTFESIRALSGRTYAEQAASIEEYVNSETGRNKLVAATTKRERLAVLQRQQVTKNLLLNMGLTADQAKQLADQFDAINGMNPKERYKESFKAQAIANALGIENAHLIQKAVQVGGVEKLSPEDQILAVEALGKLNKEASEAMTSSFTEGNNAMVSALMGLSAPTFELAKSAAGAELRDKKAAKAAAENARRVETGKQNTSRTIAMMGTALNTAQIATTALESNRLLQGIAAGVGLIAGAGIFSKGANLLGKGGGTLIAKDISSGVTKALGKVGFTGQASKLGTAAGVLSKFAAPITAGIAGFLKFNEVSERKDLTTAQKGAQIASTAAGAGGGMLAGALAGQALIPIPILGAAIGAAVGSGVGEYIGDSVGDYLSDTMSSPFNDKTTKPIQEKQDKKQKQEEKTKSQKSLEVQQQIANQNVAMLDSLNKNNEILTKKFDKVIQVSERQVNLNTEMKRLQEGFYDTMDTAGLDFSDLQTPS